MLCSYKYEGSGNHSSLTCVFSGFSLHVFSWEPVTLFTASLYFEALCFKLGLISIQYFTSSFSGTPIGYLCSLWQGLISLRQAILSVEDAYLCLSLPECLLQRRLAAIPLKISYTLSVWITSCFPSAFHFGWHQPSVVSTCVRSCFVGHGIQGQQTQFQYVSNFAPKCVQ